MSLESCHCHRAPLYKVIASVLIHGMWGYISRVRERGERERGEREKERERTERGEREER